MKKCGHCQNDRFMDVKYKSITLEKCTRCSSTRKKEGVSVVRDFYIENSLDTEVLIGEVKR